MRICHWQITKPLWLLQTTLLNKPIMKHPSALVQRLHVLIALRLGGQKKNLDRMKVFKTRNPLRVQIVRNISGDHHIMLGVVARRVTQGENYPYCLQAMLIHRASLSS